MQNLSLKKIIAGSILLMSIFLAWFIVGERKPGESIFDITSGRGESRNLSFTRGEQDSEKNGSTQNLTDSAIEKYLLELAKKNPEGPKNSTLTFPSQGVLESTLESVADIRISFVPITESDIKISKETGKAAERAYIASLQEADKKNSNKINTNEMSVLNSFFSENNSGPLVSFSDGLQSLISDLIAIPVPISMKDFHIQLINLQTRKIALLKSFLQLENDPVKTIVALKEFEQLPKEAQALALIIAEKMK